ncbi:MAG: hypothetical protein OEV00_09060 [Acidobacteriota bacterium]|nr:hypothetical protein [Acidobacteriota bacterium]MDH3785460.1 hypothetical protein [Acidobacteriota bacterium]
MRPVLPILLLLVSIVPAWADRIHLDSGGVIDTPNWWQDGDWLRYETASGVIGVPMGVVLRIEDAEVEKPRPLIKDRAPRTSKLPPIDHQKEDEAAGLIREGTRLLDARDFHGASSAFYQAMSRDPDRVVSYVGYTVAQMRLDRDGMALATVRDGLNRFPRNGQLHELLGDLMDRDERVEDAVESWTRAAAIKSSPRLDEKLATAKRDLEARGHFRFSASSHFNLRYDGEVDRSLSASFLDYLEQEFGRLSGVYRHAPSQPIAVLLYPKQDFQTVTQSPDWVGGLYDGKIRVPLGGLTHLTDRAQRVLSHELTHAVVHSKTRGNCPKWLHEGLAQWSSGVRMDSHRRERVVEQLATLQDPALWPSKQFSYGHALSMVTFLADLGGFHKLISLLDLLGEGIDPDDGLQRLYGEPFPALSRRWSRDLARDTADKR